MIKKIAERLSDDSGVTVILVVGVVLVMTILGFAIIARGSSEQMVSGKSIEGTRALHVADAGVQQAVWRVERNLASTTTATNFSLTVDEVKGSADVTIAQNVGSSWYWTITSKGTVGNASRTVKVTLFNFSIWDTSMGTGEGDDQGIEGGNESGAINGNASFTGPLYVRGGLALSGNAVFEKGPLMIYDGSLQIGGSARVGSPDTSTAGWYGPIEAYIHPTGNPPVYELRRPDRPITSTTGPQLYAKKLSTNVPKVTLPRMDSTSTYKTNSSKQSVWTADTGTNTVYRRPDGSHPVNWDYNAGPYGEKVWDTGDTTYTINSATPRFGFSPSTGQQISGTPKDSSLGTMDAIAWSWDATSSAGTLYFTQSKTGKPMTVFVNGDLTIGDNENSTTYFKGRGTLVVNGKIKILGRFVASNRADFPINPSTKESSSVGLVAAEEIEAYSGGHMVESDPDYQGAWYAAEEIEFKRNNVGFKGTLMTSELNFEQNAHVWTTGDLSANLPPSLPGADTRITLLSGWREVIK